MRKLLIVLLTLTLLVGITGVAYAATEMTNGPTTTIGNDAVNPYDSSKFADGYGDATDNTLGNANASGDDNIYQNDGSTRDEVIKSDNMTDTPQDTSASVQRTHGEYKNNTNSCASCHQTHTGAARSLLIKGGVYETCTACHDGTLGFYDVYEPSTAGTFGGTAAGNASVHMADGTIAHKYAPGGNLALENGPAAGSTGVWSDLFDCASCHAPHGSYSDRLLHYSPNDMANVSMANGGQKMEAVNVYTFGSLPAVPAKPTEKDVIVVKGAASDLGLTGVAGNAIVVMKAVSGAWVKDDLPWLNGGNHTTGIEYTNFLDPNQGATEAEQQIAVTINFSKGYATGADVMNAVTANVARCYVVKLQSATYPMIDLAAVADGYFAKAVDPQVYEKAADGIGVAIGKYCGTCHTDYRAKASLGNQGMYELAYRHTTNNDEFTCLKCHFAHGTDVTVMADAKDNTVASLEAAGVPAADATAYMLDKNPSSALKRYTNMAVCWKCHTESKSSQLVNNGYYWDNKFDTGILEMNKVPAGFGE